MQLRGGGGGGETRAKQQSRSSIPLSRRGGGGPFPLLGRRLAAVLSGRATSGDLLTAAGALGSAAIMFSGIADTLTAIFAGEGVLPPALTALVGAVALLATGYLLARRQKQGNKKHSGVVVRIVPPLRAHGQTALTLHDGMYEHPDGPRWRPTEPPAEDFVEKTNMLVVFESMENWAASAENGLSHVHLVLPRQSNALVTVMADAMRQRLGSVAAVQHLVLPPTEDTDLTYKALDGVLAEVGHNRRPGDRQRPVLVDVTAAPEQSIPLTHAAVVHNALVGRYVHGRGWRTVPFDF